MSTYLNSPTLQSVLGVLSAVESLVDTYSVNIVWAFSTWYSEVLKLCGWGTRQIEYFESNHILFSLWKVFLKTILNKVRKIKI